MPPPFRFAVLPPAQGPETEWYSGFLGSIAPARLGLNRRAHISLCKKDNHGQRPHKNPIFCSLAVKVRDLIKTLEKAGRHQVRTSGDHRIFRSSDGWITVVSGKLGDDVRPGTYRAVLRQTGLKEVNG